MRSLLSLLNKRASSVEARLRCCLFQSPVSAFVDSGRSASHLVRNLVWVRYPALEPPRGAVACAAGRVTRPAAPVKILLGGQCEVKNPPSTRADPQEKQGLLSSGKCAAPPAERFPHLQRLLIRLLRCTAPPIETAEGGGGISFDPATPPATLPLSLNSLVSQE